MKGADKTKKKLIKERYSLRKYEKKLEQLISMQKSTDNKLRKSIRTREKDAERHMSLAGIINRQLRSEIEHRKQLEHATQDARNYAENIVNTVREPLLVLDVNLMVISASRSFYQIFKVKPEDTEKQHIYNLGNHQWDIPKLRELLEDILPKTTSFDNFEVEHDFLYIGKRIMLLNAREVYQKVNSTKLILLAIEDITERRALENKLKIIATYDELTGCINFRSTMQLLENEIARSMRYQKIFTIIMIDIDHFKNINDEYGHLVGNDALVCFANVIKNSLRNVDIVGRYGGEEFIIILPETDSQYALVVLERIRRNLEQTKITSPHLENAKEFTLKFSAGIAALPYNAKGLKELLWVADSAMRQAKREGKNRGVLERRTSVRRNPMPGARIEMLDAFDKEDVKAAKIVNISNEGMLLLSDQDILNEELLCRIYCPKNESPFELACKVKHKENSDNELYRVGVHFPYIHESVKDKLSNCIESPKGLN